MTTPHHSLIKPALPELIALAKVMRPDWNPDALAGSLMMCHQRGWPWVRTVQETTRLLCDESCGPRDLSDAARPPIVHSSPPTSVAVSGAKRAREALAAVRAKAEEAASEPATGIG